MTAPLRAALLFAAIFAASFAAPTSPVAAQDKKDEKKDEKKAGPAEPAKQKAAVMANLKKAEVAKFTVTETEHFLVVSALPDDKAKALGAALEKVVPVARKSLQFEEKEEPWKGKLTVYVFPEPREFKSFMRTVVMKDPEGLFMDIRSDEPFVVDPVDAPAKASEADQFAATASAVAIAYLKSRAGTAAIPSWLQDGFARITALRAEGTSSGRYQKYKTAARTAVLGPKGGKPATLGELWSDNKSPNFEILSSSIVEYAAYGPGSMNFIKLIYGFRPDEAGNTPAAPAALEAAGWKDIPALEKAWQKWVQTGK